MWERVGGLSIHACVFACICLCNEICTRTSTFINIYVYRYMNVLSHPGGAKGGKINECINIKLYVDVDLCTMTYE